ncbi:MAG: hypothetical protein ACRD0P_31745, partial [Stackebrandtia sp.]
MQELSAAAVAVIALAVAVTIMWRRRWQGSRLTVILMLVAGFGITAGIAGSALTRLGGMVGQAAETGTSKVFG